MQVPPVGFQLAAFQPADGLASKQDFAIVDGLQPDEGPPQGGLPGTGFAHQAQGSPWLYGETHAIHRLDMARRSRQQAFFDREPDPQVPGLHEGAGGGGV